MKRLALLTVFFLILSSATALAAQWEYVNEDDGKVYYIERSSIFCDEKSTNELVFHAFFQAIYSDVARAKLARHYLEMYGYVPEDLKDVDRVRFLEYFKFANGIKYYCVDAETYLRADGSVIQALSHSRSFHMWKLAMPGSIADEMFDVTLERLIKS